MKNIILKLTEAEQHEAIRAGFARRYDEREGSTTNVYQKQAPLNTLLNDIYGAGAELAVARMLGLEDWVIPTTHREGKADIGYDIEVRWASKSTYRLCLRKKDKDARRYILTHGGLEQFVIVGWEWGDVAKSEERLEDHHDGGKPAYYTEQEALQGFAASSVHRGEVR